MFAQSLAVARLTRLTVTTHNVDGSMTAFGPAAKKRGLHGPRPPHGTPTHVSATLTILAVALGSCQARAAVSSTAPSRRRAPRRRRGDGVLVRIFWGLAAVLPKMLRTDAFTMRQAIIAAYEVTQCRMQYIGRAYGSQP